MGAAAGELLYDLAVPITILELGALLVVGLVAGTLGGMLGIGGSVIMIPALAFLFHERAWDNQHLYQAAAMIVNVIVAFPAMRRHHQAGAVPKQYVRVFLPVTITFMLVGVLLSNLLEGDALRRIFAFFLLFLVLTTLWKVFRQQKDHDPTRARITRERAGFIGVITGTVGGLLGVGGGIISVPLAQRLCRLPLRQAIAASAATMVYSSAVGSTLKMATLSQHGAAWTLAAVMAIALAPTALIGGHIGAGLTHKAPINVMRLIFAGAVAAMSARMLGVY